MREGAKPFYVVFAIAAALVVPATIALRTVIHPAILQATSDNPTPLGYTWSLLLFIIPIAALGWWFACRPDLRFPRKAFWRTIGVLTRVGFLLDLLFGNAFFIFPNKAATLGCGVPAIGGGIPIEEFVFYLTGFMLVLLSYIWCDEYWMAAYNVPDYAAAAKGIPRIVRFHFASVVLGVVLIAAAISYRKFLSRGARRVPVVLCLSRLRFTHSVRRLFLYGATIHQLARIQFHVFSASPDQFALGSDAGFALRLVGIPHRYSDGSAHRSVVRSAN